MNDVCYAGYSCIHWLCYGSCSNTICKFLAFTVLTLCSWCCEVHHIKILMLFAAILLKATLDVILYSYSCGLFGWTWTKCVFGDNSFALAGKKIVNWFDNIFYKEKSLSFLLVIYQIHKKKSLISWTFHHSSNVSCRTRDIWISSRIQTYLGVVSFLLVGLNGDKT